MLKGSPALSFSLPDPAHCPHAFSILPMIESLEQANMDKTKREVIQKSKD